ncbi:ABC transporter ATP-binding protein [Rhodoligotrophos defluvii]|uniref:ABC transporter ATP-binding protein n=1 Tax=Rhodoligotrophos defluvii TaxID=2561934 RepID=UPI0010C9F346|nr:ABC transporter ATP-binding protein [Rhodoligotrophos defluvii]
MLSLERASVFYGAAQALHDISLSVKPGEALALAGRNGAGKSTTLRTLAGQLRCRSGGLVLDGARLDKPSPEALSRAGIAYVPEDRQVFPTLTVEENLAIAQVAHRSGLWTADRVYSVFPRLAERRKALGQALSGGEQQMLAIGRALMCNPRILLLDEPTEGLAPNMVQSLVGAMRDILASGLGVILVEQNFRVPKQLADRFVILDSGRVAWTGDAVALADNEATAARLLSV